MEKPLLGAMFTCDNDNTAFANRNNWGYFRLPLSFNILPTLLQYLSILKNFEGSFCTGAKPHNSDVYDHYEGREFVLCDGSVSGFR